MTHGGLFKGDFSKTVGELRLSFPRQHRLEEANRQVGSEEREAQEELYAVVLGAR